MDYNEILCQAIDTIVGKRIAEISYDQTIVCTIIDDSKKANGQYKVQSNDKFKFDAYCENTTYKNGYQVNVLVPNGDYSLKKTILGRYTANNDTDPVAYVSPLEKIVPMTANLAGRVQTPVGLTANGDQEVYGNKPLFKTGALGNIPYDTLCIKADFKCMLQNYLVRSGNYGLRLIITTTKEVVDISLDSAKDMFGNPYGFITYFTQQQTYHLNLTGPIKGIAGYFYQRGNFTYYDDTEEFDPLVPVNNAPNIFIDNIEVYFGYDVSQIEDNTVQIYSYESENYTSDGDLNKNLNLIWYNKTEDDKYLGFTDGTFNAEKAKSEPDPEDTNIYYWIEWYRDNNDGTWPVVASGDELVSSIIGECHDLYGQTKFKARVYCNGNYYESNIITFINETLSNADSINALNLALLLHHGDSSEEAYPYYGNDNTLINVGDASRQRSLWFSYESTVGAILEPSVLNDAQVFWYISNIVTMLAPGDNKTLTKVETGSEFEKYIEPGFDCFTKKLVADAETGPTQEDKTFKYKIKRVFNANNVKNIIKLKIVDKNGHEYLAEQKFIFSTTGTCGTDYSLVISEKNGLLAYYDDADYALEAKLYDGDFQDVSPEGLRVNAYNVPEDAFDYRIATAKTQVEWAGNKVTIDAQYPIAWSGGAQYYYQGPTTIIYNSSGVNPIYYNGELAIFDNNNHKVQDITWAMHYSKDVDNEVLHYLPFVHFNSTKGYYYIKAANMFMHDIDINITLVAYQQDRPIWGQPLLIYQNQYASSLLNKWGGELKIDEKNNYLLSAMIGAGKKNTDNTFSGVLMGEVGTKTGDTSMGTIGLYGVHEGEQSFGLKIDGTMFLGKSGRGQIVLDGNNGFIASASWLNSGGKLNSDGTLGGQAVDGMAIDLQNGHIDAYNFKLTSSGLQLNSNPHLQAGEYYLNAGDENNYIRFGDKLEIKTSGANILLGDTSLDGEISEIDQALIQINADVSGLSTTVSTQGGQISTLEQTVSFIGAEVVEKADKEYSGTGFGWELTADGFVVYRITSSRQNNIFAVNNSGATLAGWTLSQNQLNSGSGTTYVALNSSSNNDYAIWAGATNAASAPFSVTKTGVLQATGVNINGDITARTLIARQGGNIAGWTIDSDCGFYTVLTTGIQCGILSGNDYAASSPVDPENANSSIRFYIGAVDKTYARNTVTLTGEGREWNGTQSAPNTVMQIGACEGWGCYQLTISFSPDSRVSANTIAGYLTAEALGRTFSYSSISLPKASDFTVFYSDDSVPQATGSSISWVRDGVDGFYFTLTLTNSLSMNNQYDLKFPCYAPDHFTTSIELNNSTITIHMEETTGAAPNWGWLDQQDHKLVSYVAKNTQYAYISYYYASNSLDPESAALRLLDDGAVLAKGLEVSGYVYNNTDYVHTLDWRGLKLQETVTAITSSAPGIVSLSREGTILDTTSTTAVAYPVYTLGVSSAMLRLDAGRKFEGAIYGTWKAESSIGTLSDRNVKTDIKDISNNYNSLFDALRPVTYKYKNGNAHRDHTGFIAQDVQEALAANNLKESEFAALCTTYTSNSKTELMLRYEEFIALNTWQIQQLKKQVAEQQQIITQLQQQLI